MSASHNVIIEQGAEYSGERYIYCDNCPDYDGQRMLFEGDTIEELLSFLMAHQVISKAYAA